MTKKHYEAIANVLKKEYDKNIHHRKNYFDNDKLWYEHKQKKQAITSVCNNLADYFAADNPKFNRDKFLTACGIKES